jgi:hypothetical protein
MATDGKDVEEQAKQVGIPREEVRVMQRAEVTVVAMGDATEGTGNPDDTSIKIFFLYYSVLSITL